MTGRPILFLAALIAGASFWFAPADMTPAWLWVAWKGSGVALLAVWAAWAARTGDCWLIALVLALGALGDVLLETSGMTVGALAFLAGHIVAITLYLRNRRARLTGSQRAAAIALLVATPVIAWALPVDRDAAWGIVLYATALGAMAASAWASRFPRYRVGVGAILFVVSDLLIFARLGPLADSPIPHLVIWPAYFAGQALIAWGVVTTLDGRRSLP